MVFSRTILAASLACALALARPGIAAPAKSAATPPPTGRVIVVRAAELHVGDGHVHVPGQLLLENGRIKALGEHVDVPEGAEIWDEPTGIITPWLVDPSVPVRLGMGEGGKLESALLRAADARPGWDPYLPMLREQGIFAVALVPDGASEILGRSAVVGTLGPGAAGAPILVADAQLVMAVASGAGSTASAAARLSLIDLLEDTERYSKKRAEWAAESKGARGTREGARRTKQRADTSSSDDTPARMTRDSVGKRHAGRKASDEPKLEPAREIVASVIDKKLTLRVNVDGSADVAALLALAKKRALKLVIAGCRECAGLATELGISQISVVLEPSGQSAADVGDSAFNPELAAALAKAGVRLAVSAGTEWPSGPSWLRVLAADLVGCGVPRATAIAAMSGEAARAAGLPDPWVAVGSPARFIVWDRDPLQPAARSLRRVVPEDVGLPRAAPAEAAAP